MANPFIKRTCKCGTKHKSIKDLLCSFANVEELLVFSMMILSLSMTIECMGVVSSLYLPLGLRLSCLLYTCRVDFVSSLSCQAYLCHITVWLLCQLYVHLVSCPNSLADGIALTCYSKRAENFARVSFEN